MTGKRRRRRLPSYERALSDGATGLARCPAARMGNKCGVKPESVLSELQYDRRPMANRLASNGIHLGLSFSRANKNLSTASKWPSPRSNWRTWSCASASASAVCCPTESDDIFGAPRRKQASEAREAREATEATEASRAETNEQAQPPNVGPKLVSEPQTATCLPRSLAANGPKCEHSKWHKTQAQISKTSKPPSWPKRSYRPRTRANSS